MVDLTGKVAVVTGGGSGLGAAMAKEFAVTGAGVAVLDIDAAAAERTAAAIAAETGVPVMWARTDVASSADLEAAAARVRDELGGCDVLCANVGVQQFGALDRLTDQDWEWVLSVNVLGTVRTVRAFLPLVRERTGWRRVVVTASSSALVPGVRLGAYVTSKFAVQGYGEVLRMELAAEGIGVSVLFPAGMMTNHLQSSAQARPADRGEWVMLSDDIEVMMASRGVTREGHTVTAEHAVRNLLAELDADNPYIITHGAYRAEYQRRADAMDAAFSQLEPPSKAEVTGPPSIRELWDIQQIQQLKARYFRFLDTKDWDGFRGLFTDDCVHYLPQESGQRFQTNEEYFASTIPSLADAVTVHHGHMPEITLLSETEAEGIWAMHDYVQMERPDRTVSIKGYGHYIETYRKCADGQWRISSKRNERLRVDPVPPTPR